MNKTSKPHITLLTTNSIGFPPFVFHKAILFETQDGQPFILHQTTSGIEILNYDTFLQKRHVYLRKDYILTKPFDPERIKASETRKFDWMGYNCEDFVSKVIEQNTGKHIICKSPQRTFWMILLALTLISLILLRR